MKVEAGQYWMHMSPSSGFSIWEVTALLVPEHNQATPVTIKLIASEKGSQEGYVQPGHETEIDSSFEDTLGWKFIAKEDLPLLLLGEMP